MTTPTIIYLIVAWYFAGCLSFWFWLTREYEFNNDFSDYFVMLLCGFTGVLTWIVCWSCHFKDFGYSILGLRNK